jgi:hypothetical protein
MAGPFTHMLICESAIDPTEAARLGRPKLPDELIQLLKQNQSYLLLGAIAPDLPAISDQVWSQRWSDEMHDKRLVRLVVDLFEQSANCSSEARDAILAWLFGFVAHIVGDAVVHPIVNLVMAAVKNQGIHQEIEICMDSLTFKDKKGVDLQSVPYFDGLKACRKTPAAFAELMALWQKCITDIVPDFDGDCVEWYGTYLAGFHVATVRVPKDAATHLHCILGNYAYRPVDDIGSGDRTDYFDHIPVPIPPGHGAFLKDVFDRAVGHLIEIWQQMWLRVPRRATINLVVPDCNLNTGADNHTHKLVLWP